MTEKERIEIMFYLRNTTTLKGKECMCVEKLLIDMQYKRKSEIRGFKK